jgi:hypothetical protein
MISAITLGEIEYGLQVTRSDPLKQEAYHLVLVTNDKMDRIRDVCEDLQVENWATNASE